MTRDSLRDRSYFTRGIEFKQGVIDKDRACIAEISSHEGRALCAGGVWQRSVKLVIQRYGRGDALPEIGGSVTQALDALALKRATLASVQLDEEARQMHERLDLGVLYEGLTLLAFMVALRMPAADILRAVQLLGHPGEDAVLDHVARACGDTSRECDVRPKFPKVHAGLAAVVAAASEQRSSLLGRFVAEWYRKMRPIYWHDNHKGGEGAYFGYWCFEGALVAMLFSVDDSAVQGHPNYPGDLTRHFHATA